MEEHVTNKSFYVSIRPMLIFCKMFGAYPLKNTLSSKVITLQYNLFSIHTLWNPFLQTICGLLYFKFITFPWWKISKIFVLVRMVMVILSSIYSDQHLPTLLKLIDNIDRRLSKLEHQPKSSNGLLWMFACISVLLISTTSSTFMLRPEEGTKKAIIQTALIIIPWYQFQICVALYLLFCINISYRFRCIKELWEDTLSNLMHTNYVSSVDGKSIAKRSDIQLEEIRMLHSDLLTAIDELNRCYGTRMAIFLASIFQELLTIFYECLLGGLPVEYGIIFAMYHIECLFILGKITENLSTSVSK
ncbi:hypothetical protein L9F63_014917, partial [Diploptera punctata]